MEVAKFFTSLLWGSILCMPVMILVGREVDGMEYFEEWLWVPIVTAMLSLMMKTLLEKKKR